MIKCQQKYTIIPIGMKDFKMNIKYWIQTIAVLWDIFKERLRQNKKFGVSSQDHLANGTGSGYYQSMCKVKRDFCDSQTVKTMDSILLEEVYEAMAEKDPIRLKTELTEAAAVCVKWIEKLNRVDIPAQKSNIYDFLLE